MTPVRRQKPNEAERLEAQRTELWDHWRGKPGDARIVGHSERQIEIHFPDK